MRPDVSKLYLLCTLLNIILLDCLLLLPQHHSDTQTLVDRLRLDGMVGDGTTLLSALVNAREQYCAAPIASEADNMASLSHNGAAEMRSSPDKFKHDDDSKATMRSADASPEKQTSPDRSGYGSAHDLRQQNSSAESSPKSASVRAEHVLLPMIDREHKSGAAHSAAHTVGDYDGREEEVEEEVDDKSGPAVDTDDDEYRDQSNAQNPKALYTNNQNVVSEPMYGQERGRSENSKTIHVQSTAMEEKDEVAVDEEDTYGSSRANVSRVSRVRVDWRH
jgi:hypothetical protein